MTGAARVEDSPLRRVGFPILYPYEEPEHSELAIETTNLGIDEAVQQILLKLTHEGYLR